MTRQRVEKLTEMKIHTLLARAIYYAIEDRNAFVSAWGNEGPEADAARLEIKQLRALHEKLKITPSRRLASVMMDDAPSVDVIELKRMHERGEIRGCNEVLP